ncbi:hypothetical protein TM7_0169 [candidate division TM7 genomosp. GTL1]|nr:hypothetical protein TM7_0169 [candidate division TM7 genomosp. GTL1]
MKIIKKSSKKKKVLFAAMVLALVFGGGVVFAAINKVGPFAGQTSTDANNQINYDPPTDEQKESGDQAADKENADTSEDLPAKPSGNDESTTPPADTQKVGVQITAANQNSGQLQVRTIIQTVNPGTCTLKLSRSGSQSITQTAPTQPLSSTSTCQGFNVSTSGLAKGAWHLTVTFKGANQQGTATEEVTIN